MQSAGGTPRFLNLGLRAVAFSWSQIVWTICSLLFFPLAIVTLFSSMQDSFVLIPAIDAITILKVDELA